MRAPCVVDGCEQPRRGRGYCSTHWLRWRKHGDPTVVLRLGVDYRQASPCSIDDCDRTAKARGWCDLHYTRWRKHGDPLVVGERLGRPLKGSVPTWTAVHKRLRRQRGRAAEHRCADCGGPAREWSYDGRDPAELRQRVRGTVLRYSLDLDHYEPRCTPCHRRFDARQAAAR